MELTPDTLDTLINGLGICLAILLVFFLGITSGKDGSIIIKRRCLK